MTDAAVSRSLERQFAGLGIPHDAPGFYDHPAFVAEENRDPRFLERYAQYVESRPYRVAEIEDARHRIAVAAEAVRAAVAADRRVGACIDASMMLSRMLDRLKVWNYLAVSTLTITFPTSTGFEQRFFWAIDKGEFAAPHAFVVAPPFGVIDVTIRYQPYGAGEAVHIPESVLADRFAIDMWTPEDLANSAWLAALRNAGVSLEDAFRAERSSMIEVIERLPPRSVQQDGLTLKYIIIGASASDGTLAEFTGYTPCGRTAQQIFEDDVQPLVRR